MGDSNELLREWERHRVGLNRELYNEGVGLPYDTGALGAHGRALSDVSERLLSAAAGDGQRLFALEGWSEGRQVPHDQKLREAQDACLVAPHLSTAGEPLTWRSWKRFERENHRPEVLSAAFEYFVEQSAVLEPVIRERYEAVRADYARHGFTPASVFAAREETTPEALRSMLERVGRECAAPFQEALDRVSTAVFGRPAGPAELRALYLNRMYDPYEGLVDGVDPVALVRRAFAGMGFDLSAIPLDVEERPGKYPGAFCFPIQTPGDVRVSVRVASPHHLLDMLFHEFGHAVHFAGIRGDLPVLDRYWIHSGSHETFSTFFELLLGEPALVTGTLGMSESAARGLREFDHFKSLLVGTWIAASALTSLEAWGESLDWTEIERRYAAHLREFTGVIFPPGFARLNLFVSGVSVYPAGYVMALVRCAHWREQLRKAFGPEWWTLPEAGDSIRKFIRPGGAVRFPDEWNEPSIFLRELVDYQRAKTNDH